MNKITITLYLFVSFCISVSAQEVPDSIKITGDSTQYLSIQDTIFLDFSVYQEKTFHHYIAPKQTLYSLAKFYGMSVEELYFYNPTLRDSAIAIGQQIKIPIPNKSIIRYKTEDFDSQKTRKRGTETF